MKRFMLPPSMCILFSFLLVIPALAQESAPVTDADKDREILEAMQEQYRTGWLEMDAEKVLSLFEEGATLQPNRMKPITGMEAIRAFWFPEDGSVTTIHRFEVTPIVLEVMDSLAVGTHRSLLEWSYEKGDTKMGRLQQGINTVVFRRQADGSWKIWRRMWTDIYSEPR